MPVFSDMVILARFLTAVRGSPPTRTRRFSEVCPLSYDNIVSYAPILANSGCEISKNPVVSATTSLYLAQYGNLLDTNVPGSVCPDIFYVASPIELIIEKCLLIMFYSVKIFVPFIVFMFPDNVIHASSSGQRSQN